ncbi:MAG TPA: hypothetical protein P5560_04665 [Thermotogota bacterium]|nr:hypothetical protein [Thermotogota bacterium]HRW92227.1 hypothetical protein [Thermotogota bacterium]
MKTCGKVMPVLLLWGVASISLLLFVSCTVAAGGGNNPPVGGGEWQVDVNIDYGGGNGANVTGEADLIVGAGGETAQGTFTQLTYADTSPFFKMATKIVWELAMLGKQLSVSRLDDPPDDDFPVLYKRIGDGTENEDKAQITFNVGFEGANSIQVPVRAYFYPNSNPNEYIDGQVTITKEEIRASNVTLTFESEGAFGNFSYTAECTGP